jgi:hypothetical protein
VIVGIECFYVHIFFILNSRIKRLAEERDDLQDQVRRLKLDLEEEKNRNQKLERSTPCSPEEAEWESKRLIDDYKFKLQKCEQDINTLQTNVSFTFADIFQSQFIHIFIS